MKYERLAKKIAFDMVRQLEGKGLKVSEFPDLMAEAYMVSILTYCRVERLGPMETLRLFHEKVNQISEEGYKAACAEQKLIEC